MTGGFLLKLYEQTYGDERQRLERQEIAERLAAVEIEHGRRQHPSSWPDDESIAADIDAIARGLANLRTIDQLSPGDLLKIGDTWARYEFLRGSTLTVTVEGACAFSEVEIDLDERWQWQPAVGF